MHFEIRPETTDDLQEIWNVNCAAFDGEAESRLVDALRAGGYAGTSLVAEAQQKIVGHILFSKLCIVTNAGKIDALSLAPMAVLPGYQRQGIGGKLIADGLRECRQKGGKIVVVLGHPEFYPQFGFSAELAKSLVSPFGGGDAWMALELVDGSMTGVAGQVEYPPPFASLV